MAIIIGDNLANILEKLGLKESDVKKRGQKVRQYEQQRAANYDALNALKEKIAAVEKIILRKKKEMENSTGGVKRILRDEIVRLFRQIDSTREEEQIIGANIDRVNVALAKYRVLDIIEGMSLGEQDLEDLSCELEDVADSKLAADKAFEYLNGIHFKQTGDELDVDARLEALGREGESALEDDELPAELARRIAELEGE